MDKGDGRDRQQDRLEPPVPRPEQPGERPEDDGGRGRVDQVAGHHEDEQRDREGHVGAGPLLPERQEPVEAHPLQDDREELHGEDRDVEADAPGDLEHRRVIRGLQAELVEVPGQAEVRDERDGDERVAQQAHQHRFSAEPVQVFSLEDVDRPGHGERPGGDGDPDQVEDDPEAPRVGVGEVRAAAEAEGEPGDHRHAAERHQGEQDPVERGHQPLVQPLESDVMAVVRRASPVSTAARAVRHRLHPFSEVRVDGPEQGADRHHRGRHGPERRRRKAAEMVSPRTSGNPSFSKGTAERYSTLVPPSLLLSVDVVDVLVRAVGHAFVGERQHLLAASVAQGVGGARLDARRGRDRLQESLGLVRGRRPVERDRDRLIGAVGAVRALLDLRRELVPFAPSARPRDRRACSTGSRCTCPRRRKPVRPAGDTAPSSGRPTRSRAPGSGSTGASRRRCPGRPGSAGSPSRGRRSACRSSSSTWPGSGSRAWAAARFLLPRARSTACRPPGRPGSRCSW